MPKGIKGKPKSGNSYSMENIPDDLWFRTKQLAFVKHISLKELILTAIQTYVSTHKEELDKMLSLIGPSAAQQEREKDESELPNPDNL